MSWINYLQERRVSKLFPQDFLLVFRFQQMALVYRNRQDGDHRCRNVRHVLAHARLDRVLFLHARLTLHKGLGQVHIYVNFLRVFSALLLLHVFS